jgi:predicted metal-dependent peptidase
MPKKAPPPPLTPAELDKARADAKHLIEKARAFVILDHPFFATIMLKRPFVESLACPTLAVTGSGTIFYNPAFIATKTADNVVWAICHEILHYASGHAMRRQHRDPAKFNYAADMWINDTLNRANVGQKIEGCIDVPGSADRTVEDIYAGFPPDDDNGGGGGQGQGSGGKNTTGQGDDPIADDMEDDGMTESEQAEVDANRKIEVAEAAQVAKMKGKLPGILQKFAEDTIEQKTPWYDILQEYMNGFVSTEASWTKPNKRYTPDFYLPAQANTPSMGEVVVQVDVSGSISRQEIRCYNGHLKRILEDCKPSKVHVTYVDTRVQRHDVFEFGEEIKIEYFSGGGTDMPEGLRYLDSKGIEPDVAVVLTDGFTDFGNAPDFPVVWCISTEKIEATHGKSIHFDMNEEG